jgi:hypothetical protein
MSEENKKLFKLEVKLGEDRIYTFSGPGGPDALDQEDTKEAEAALYNILKHLITINWRRELIEAERAKEAEKPKEEETSKEDK